MKRIVVAVAFIMFVVVSLAYAADRGTAAEAKAMLDKAIAFYKANGHEKAIAAFNDPKGSFVNKDLYIFALDSNAIIIAHGANLNLIGKGMVEIRDADEKNFIAEMYAIGMTKGMGIVDYKWVNPITNIVENKSVYIERVDGVILGCGYYKARDWQIYPVWP
ncbi:MAG: cache domain-containing protein [Syntrophales bacterium]